MPYESMSAKVFEIYVVRIETKKLLGVTFTNTDVSDFFLWRRSSCYFGKRSQTPEI